MTAGAEKKPDIKHRLREELINYAIVTAYLFICFSALFLYKTALVSPGEVQTLPFGLALGKALILGKFILIGEGVGIGGRVTVPRMAHQILLKSLMFLLLLLVLTLLEELLVGWFHGHDAQATFSEIIGSGTLELVSQIFIMLLVLIPLIAFKTIGEALGPGVLQGLLFDSSRKEGKRND